MIIYKLTKGDNDVVVESENIQDIADHMKTIVESGKDWGWKTGDKPTWLFKVIAKEAETDNHVKGK